jgi:acetolactate synthase-1/2/3 large subunit
MNRNARAAHGGELVARELVAHGVRTLYTLCGGHISPILAAAKALGVRVVDTRHEATAVFAADATARLTGIPGVAAVTAGPGLTNAITAVKNAQLAQSSLVLLGGAAPTLLKGRGALQDIDQIALLRPHVKLALAIRRVRDLAPAVRRAFAVARDGVPGPVFVECPLDLLYPEALVREMHGAAARASLAPGQRLLRWYVRRHLDRVFAGSGAAAAAAAAPADVAASATAPPIDARALRRAAAALAGASRPLLVVGSQATLDVPGLAATAAAIESLGVPTYLSGMARGLLGATHPLLLRHRRRDALRAADCVLLAGVPCDFRLDYGRHVAARATLVSANRSRADLRLNRRPDIGALGDPAAFLRALGAAVAPRAAWRGWHETLRVHDAEREREIDAGAAAPARHVNPLALLREVDARLPHDALLVADGGDFVATASYVLRARGPLGWLDPGVFGTLGVGAGFALGAALARPGCEVWLLLGDGAAGYGLVEFDTFVRHGVPVIAVVGNDAGWTQIAREQVKVLRDDVGTVLARTDYDAVAAGFGAVGLPLTDGTRTAEVLAAARTAAGSGRPVLVNAWLDRTDFREGSISM